MGHVLSSCSYGKLLIACYRVYSVTRGIIYYIICSSRYLVVVNSLKVFFFYILKYGNGQDYCLWQSLTSNPIIYCHMWSSIAKKFNKIGWKTFEEVPCISSALTVLLQDPATLQKVTTPNFFLDQSQSRNFNSMI